MNLTGVWGWLGWGLVAAVPLLIFLLYFLKLRRAKIEVPSTYLWQRSLEDMQVNSLWQRLRSSLLMWLQLLIAILLLLSLLPLGCRMTERVGQRHIFLLDTSASMRATDVAESRFEQAKAQIEAKIRQLRDIDLAMLMTCDNQAQIRQGYTSDRNLLLRKLEEIRPRWRLTDMEEALVAASGLTHSSQTRETDETLTLEEEAEQKPQDRTTLFMYSDGGFPPIKDSALGELDLVFIPIGEGTVKNLGITTFNAQWNERRNNWVDLYARIENFSQVPMPVELELLRNGNIIDAVQRPDLAPGESLSLDFQDSLPSVQGEVIEYELRILGQDDLLADNVAHSVVNPGRKPRVALVTSGSPNLQAALSTNLISAGLQLEVHDPEFLESADYLAAQEQALYDLVVFDRVAPRRMPLANTMFWGAAPPDSWSLEALEPPVFALYGNNLHPLMVNVNLDSLAFLQAFKVSGPPASVELLTANEGGLMAIGPRLGYQDLVLGFSLMGDVEGQTVPLTDWPSRLSFPVFIYRVLEFLGRMGQREIQSSVRPGQLVRFRLDSPEDALSIVLPNGTSQTLRRQSDGDFLFTATDQPGIYRVLDSNQVHLRSLAVSLTDRRESDIAVKEQLQIGYVEVESTRESTIESDGRLWRYLLLAALAVVMLEWVVYNRRILM